MSPEQGAGEAQLDGRSDLYSLGCVVYEMLAGEPPFTGPTAQAIAARHLRDPVPPLRTVRDVPESVDTAIRRALAKAPADRFATAERFGAALAGAIDRRTLAGFAWSRLAWVALALAVTGGGLWLRGRARRTPVVAAASVIAVLPPVPTSPDTALTRLARNLVVTLSADLNGVADIRTIDASTILAQTLERDREMQLDEAVALGRRLGASGVVHGTLARDGDLVRLDLGLYTVTTGTPVARAFVTSGPDDYRALTDSATWALLRQVWRSGIPPSPSLAGLTTRSLPALRAFLDGERAVVEARWPDAAAAFGAAVDRDSAFWLAYWRLAVAIGWQAEQPDSATMTVVRAHLPDLPERERLHAQTFGVAPPALFDLGRRLTERFPDYWPGWLSLGDDLFHVGPLAGYSLHDAGAALERAVDLNPMLLSAWDHLFKIAITHRDAAALERAARRMEQLGSRLGWHHRMHLQLTRRPVFGGPLADSIVALTLSLRDRSGQIASARRFATWYPAVQVEFSARVLRGGALPATADAHRLALAVAWAARGAWDTAMVAIDAYAAHSPDSAAVLDPYRFAVLGAWLGALEPEVARARRVALVASRDLAAASESQLRWLDGLLAVAESDAAGLRRAAVRVRDPDDVVTRALRAFESMLTGNQRAAAESLAAIWWDDASGGDATFNGVHRLVAARVLAAGGEWDRAARLLRWHEADVPNHRWWMGVPILNGVTYLEAARVEAARGDAARARVLYEEFVRRYDRPVPPLRGLVDEARTVVGRLDRQAAPGRRGDQ
jgi:serine/threonine-protein kinase